MKVSNEDLVKKTKEELIDNGLTVNKSIIDVILKTYTGIQRRELLKGNSIELPKIGTIVPSWRRVSDAFTDVPYTSKMKINIDNDLKKKMNKKLSADPNYRSAVGAQEL